MANPTWTSEQVLALAPDAGSAQAGKGLARAAKWRNLGCSQQALWGECQGSGSSPYLTRIDLSEPAFKCSCPSRKFPCKHSLGLLLLFAQDASSFAQTQPPGWVTEWLESRAQRAEKKAEKAAQKVSVEGPQPDTQAQSRRAARREERVAAGLAELQLWMRDLVRGGLASAQEKPERYWETMAARLVDAQAPGVARLVRLLGAIPGSGPDWPERLLEALGRLHLLVEGYGRSESLPGEMREEIRTLVGWSKSREELLENSGVRDCWAVVGQTSEMEERLLVQRNWLVGLESGRTALLLNFAAPGQQLEVVVTPGMAFDAELVYYPGALPRRALIKERFGSPSRLRALPAGKTICGAMESCRAALCRNPWTERFALLVEGVVVRPLAEDAWCVASGEGHALRLASRFGALWRLVAVSAGAQVRIFGEWDGEAFLPLSLDDGTGVHLFSARFES